MADCTKATSHAAAGSPPPTASAAGLLRPDELARHVEVVRRPSGLEASRWVENSWSLRWDLPEGRRFLSQVLPHPTCSLTIELGDAPRPEVPPGQTLVITGVVTRRFDVDVRGWGRVVGLRFRPGGLAALSGHSAASWTDRVVPASAVLPEDTCETLRDPNLAADPAAWAAVAESSLVSHAPGSDARYDHLLEIVAEMLADRSLLTVVDVAKRHGVTPRTLQRLFNHYVGVGPKWVLARYRMHDLVSEIDAGYTGSITDLAHRFGWYDQAHLTRDFTALVGMTPGEYRDRSDPHDVDGLGQPS